MFFLLADILQALLLILFYEGVFGFHEGKEKNQKTEWDFWPTAYEFIFSQKTVPILDI